MPKATMKIKAIIIIILVILLACGCFLIFRPKEQVEMHSIYLDLSIPLYQDSNVDENFKQASILVQAINEQLNEEENLEIIVPDVDSENYEQEKDLMADLTLSIQCLKADEVKTTSYLPISNDAKHDDSLKFANIVASNLSDLNYQGNYYYYLLPVGNDMYNELISQEKITDETAIGLPLLDYCQKPIIMLNYYYQDNNEEVMNALANRLAEAIKTYFNEA